MNRTIIHVDMDAFFASVEVRDNPALKGKPLIIGALPSERGVVSTCSYEARKYGIHSAMNIKEAFRRCPHGIFMHGDMKKYEEASRKIHEIMLTFTDKIEFVALDEGYMDVTASLRLFGSAENIGRKLKEEIYKKVGVTCSVGISYSMMGAKFASEEKKPDGFFVIPDKETLFDLLHSRNVGEIRGVGSKTAEKLKKWGILTVDDLLKASPQILGTLGKSGEELLKLAKGEDDREVVPDGVSKSIGREHTFQVNIDDKETMKAVLLLISRDISLRAKRKGLYGKCVTLKIKFSDMHSITRSKTKEATNSSKDIYTSASELLDNLNLCQSVRLVGVTLSNLSEEREKEEYQISLFDPPEEETSKKKTDALEDAIFELHNKYGRNILKTAKELEAGQKLIGKAKKEKEH